VYLSKCSELGLTPVSQVRAAHAASGCRVRMEGRVRTSPVGALAPSGFEGRACVVSLLLVL
jgi:hypothetical protein